MIRNILKERSSFGISKILKTKAVREPMAVVIGVCLCCALELSASGAQIQQPVSKPEQSSNRQTEPQPSSRAHSEQKQQGELKPSIPDVEVFNQDGKRIHFYSDLVKGKVVVISFAFSTCTLICLMQADNLSKLQALLGERLGRDVNLVSISTDPETDTPERLKAWATQFGAKPGWTFVTGKKSEIDKLALAITGAIAIKGEHSPVVFIGSDKKWIRTYGLAGPERFNKIIEEMTNEPLTEPGQR